MGLFQNFPYTNFHSINLDWILQKTRESLTNSESAVATANEIKEYVNNYFANLNLDEETQAVVNRMVESGEFNRLFDDVVANFTGEWLAENIGDSVPPIDSSLSVENAAADAKIVGDLFKQTFMLSRWYDEDIPDGTDWNSLLNVGNYRVATWSSCNTMLNVPEISGGVLKVGYLQTDSNKYQLWMLLTSAKKLQIWMRGYYNGWSSWVCLTEPWKVHYNPTKLRIMGYNIGEFNWGQDGPLTIRPKEKIANYKKFFGKYNPDFLLMEECTENITDNYPSSDMFNPLFDKNAIYKNNDAVYTNYQGTLPYEDGGFYIRTADQIYCGRTACYDTKINNTEVRVYSGFLTTSVTKELRISAFENLVKNIWMPDNVIMYLDCNCADADELNRIKQLAEEAGFVVANGAYFGTEPTLHSTSVYRAVDNIFIKGSMKLKNFFVCADEYDKLSSDHYAIVADVEFYG